MAGMLQDTGCCSLAWEYKGNRWDMNLLNFNGLETQLDVRQEERDLVDTL